MDELRILADLQGGYFTRGDARTLGYDDRAVAAAVRHHAWHRFRRGSYSFADAWTSWDDVERHRVRCRAVLRSLGPGVALSHASAVAHRGDLPTWGLDLRRVHVTRLDGGAGRVEGDVVHHEGFCVDGDLVSVDAGLSVGPTRSVLEAGSRAGPEVGLVLMSSLLHAGIDSRDGLEAQFERMEHWPWMRRMHVPLWMADGRYESVGEIRGCWLCWAARLPAPIPQYEVRHPDTDEVLARCDWGWPDRRAVGEFDGKVKYGRLLKPGQDPGDVVFAEKKREDLVREVTDMRMIRFVWDDYSRMPHTVARLRRVLDRPKADLA